MNKADLEQKILQAVQEYEKANPERSVYDIRIREEGIMKIGKAEEKVMKIDCIIHQNE